MKAFACALLTLSLLLPCNATTSATTPNALTTPAHALILTMLERDLTYDPENSRFVWLAAYYMLTLSAPNDPQATWTGNRLLLPADRLMPSVKQMFARANTSPPLPRQLTGTIALSLDGKQLLLAAGDPGQTQLIWLSCQNTTWQVALISPDADEPLCHAQVTLNRLSTAIETCTITEQLPQTCWSAAVVISGYGHRRTG